MNSRGPVTAQYLLISLPGSSKETDDTLNEGKSDDESNDLCSLQVSF